MIRFDGSAVIVTGAGSGIGRATAERFAEFGAAVVVADIDENAAEETVTAITARGDVAHKAVVDVADQASIARFAATVLELTGPPAVLVNNAGWDEVRPFISTDRGFWERVTDINYLGPVAVTHAFLQPMIDAERGRIVNVASDAGRVGSMGEAVYAGAKGGVIAFTKSLARETARYGIAANCVSPGPTDTALFHQQAPKVQEALIRAIPYRRLAQPGEIADAVCYLASDRASYVTGQVISVSGGLTMSS